MKFELNESMKSTQQEWGKKSPWIVILLVVILFMASNIIDLLITTTYLLFKHPSVANGTTPELTAVEEQVMNLASFPLLLILLLLANKYILKQSTRSLGFFKKDLPKNYSLGMGIGIGMLLIIYIVNLILGAVSSSFNSDISVAFIIFYIVVYGIQGLTEEVMTRSLIMNVYSARKNVLYGIIINSIVFALIHAGNPNLTLLAIVNLFLAGIFFSLLFYWSGNIWVAGAAHSLWNFTLGPILGIEVSGSTQAHTLLTTQAVEDKAFLSGGNFGLEGGIVLTIVTILLCALLWKLCQKKGLIHN